MAPGSGTGARLHLRLSGKVDDILLEAPTGVGKSAVAIALARAAEASGASTYISTQTINLEEQYIRDFESLGLRPRKKE
jgi:Rad3-related DNA helicase